MAFDKDTLTTIVSKEGKIRLPEALFRRYGWDIGTEITIEENINGVLLKTTSTSSIKSGLGKKG